VEGLGLTRLRETYAGRRVLVTGHTGFKGRWLVLWLARLRAEVTGFALPADERSHWIQLGLDVPTVIGDVRDCGAVRDVVRESRPDIVFHLAAQPLVRFSYNQPLETWSVNVVGTLAVLDACRLQGVRAVVVVTSDKCYDLGAAHGPYRENDRLGGHDPYSASKAAAELVVSSYRRSFFDGPDAPAVASVRAGNAIGGGDWALDRIVPDVARAVLRRHPVEVRLPRATRPWQHVLDPLRGYLMVGERLLLGDRDAASAWNFGPSSDESHTVLELLECLREFWPGVEVRCSEAPHVHEAARLALDSRKAYRELAWRPVWPFREAVAMTATWYRRFIEERQVASSEQLEAYLIAAAQSAPSSTEVTSAVS
jgi:CDP-glucose 4,6-dehydratase